MCSTSNTMQTFFLIKLFIKIIFILVPIVLMYRLIRALFSTIISGNNLKENLLPLLKTIIACFIIYFIPTIIPNLFILFLEPDSNFSKIATCYNEASTSKIKELKSKEQEELKRIEEERRKELESLQINIEKAKILIENMAKDGTLNSSETTSVNAKLLLDDLERMSKIVKNSKKGSWYYLYKGYSKTFDEAIKNNNKHTVCSLLVTWSLKNIGILSYKQQVYQSPKNGYKLKFKHGGKESIEKYATIIALSPQKTAKQLEKEGNPLKPGDIVCFGGIEHMNVYVGKNSNGDALWYDAGRGSDGYWKNGTFYFKSFGPVKINHYYNNIKIRDIIRLK